jgi:tetratricopeptide (TPR) repeat protein
MYRKAVRDGHEFMVALLLRRLGSIREEQDLPQAALLAYREALEIDQRFYGSSDVTVDGDIRLIAGVLTKSGTEVTIEGFLQELIEKQSSERESGSELANTLSSLGQALAATGKFGDAEEILKHAIALKRDNLGAESVEVQFDIHELAKLLIQDKRPVEADALLRRAVRITEDALGSHDARVVNIMGTLATALVAQGSHDEAIAVIKRIADTSAEVWGPENEQTLKVLAFLDRVKTLGDRD